MWQAGVSEITPLPDEHPVGAFYAEKLHRMNEDHLGPYFRIIYSMLRRISEASFLNDEEKIAYGNLLRSQLTSTELFVIGVNGLAHVSGDLRGYLEEFRMFKYLPRNAEMVPLTFNTYGHAFERGLSVIEKSYSVAEKAMELNRDTLKSQLKTYLESLESDEPSIGEWDADGIRIWDQEQVLEFEIDDAEAALVALRRAYILVLYHHWERSMRRQFNMVKGDHAELVRVGRRRGMTFHTRLEAVRDMANLFKHANDRWASALLVSWPGILPRGFTTGSFRDGHSAAVLTDEVVREVVEILGQSGPRTNQVYSEP